MIVFVERKSSSFIGSRPKVCFSTSINIGVAFAYLIAFAVATNDIGCVITSSVGWTPATSRAI
jgi:hypothetical protein